MLCFRRRAGYTLLELLVVMTIIGILATVGLVSYSATSKASRDARRRQDLRSLANAMEQYKAQNGTYPQTVGWVYSDGTGIAATWLTPYLVPTYMSKAATDPLNTGGPAHSGGYTYGYFTGNAYGGTNGGYYMLIGHMEAPTASDKTTKCMFPDGTTFGSTNSGAAFIYTDNFFLCNQQ